MTSIIEKRASLHRNLKSQATLNDKLKAKLTQSQTLANIGVSTCMIAHEVNNLLTPVSAYANLAINNPDDNPLAAKALQKAASNAEKAAQIMKSILKMANGEKIEKKSINLNEIINEVFSSLGRDFKKDGIKLKLEIPEDLTIFAVPLQIQQVFMNLILNARDAMLDTGGSLTITASTNCETVKVDVSDTGRGIAQKDCVKIFEPFFTTKQKGTEKKQNSGSGLGLAFCETIINAHQGSISAKSSPQKGTTMSITLPI